VSALVLRLECAGGRRAGGLGPTRADAVQHIEPAREVGVDLCVLVAQEVPHERWDLLLCCRLGLLLRGPLLPGPLLLESIIIGALHAAERTVIARAAIEVDWALFW
jgi:hypothetical protein